MPFVGFLPLEERLWYIRPVESLSEKIVELTGITDEFLADQPAEEEVFPQIMEFSETASSVDTTTCGSMTSSCPRCISGISRYLTP